MSEPFVSRLKQTFRERLNRTELPEDVSIVYRVIGGMPHERIEQEFRLASTGETTVKMRDALRGIPQQETSRTLDRGEVRDLLQQMDLTLDDLVPRSEARFPPDSAVGSITLNVAGEQETLFFLADEELRIAEEAERLPDEEKPLARERIAASPITLTARRISDVTQRLLQDQGGLRDE